MHMVQYSSNVKVHLHYVYDDYNFRTNSNMACKSINTVTVTVLIDLHAMLEFV